MSALPPFLVAESGANSGFMIAQVTAAALALENKSLAHPASVDSIPTVANQEDHVSMPTFAARRLLDMGENTAAIVAIELLAAAQGINFRQPLTTSPALLPAMAAIRARPLLRARPLYGAGDRSGEGAGDGGLVPPLPREAAAKRRRLGDYSATLKRHART